MTLLSRRGVELGRTLLFPVLTGLVVALLPLPARAAPASPEDALRTASETRGRDEINGLFQSLCPQQCVLLSVTATVEDEPAANADPGFDTATGTGVPHLQALDAAVLVDAALPQPFRARLKDVVGLRLKALGAATNSVSVESIVFPPRDPQPQPAGSAGVPMTMPAAAPASTAVPERSTSVPPPMAAGEAPVTLRIRMLDAAPALVAVGMFALVLLVLGALLLLAVKRREEPSEWVPDSEASAEAGTNGSNAGAFPAARAQRLEKTLMDERGLRNAIVRDALTKGETNLVAQWVRELGEFVVCDLHAERALSSALRSLAEELAKPPVEDPAQRAQTLYDLEARVFTTRLSRTAEPAEAQFSFFEGLRAERFLAAYEAVSTGAREIGLRFAPPMLREAALRRLSANERTELALGWVRRPSLTPSYVAAVVEEWRAALAASASTSEQVDRALEGLLDLLPRAEQDSLLARVRAEGEARVGVELVTESMLQKLSAEVLSATVLSVPQEVLVRYLARADQDLREALLVRCPLRQQEELRAELTSGVFTTRDEFFAARRTILEAVREQLLQRGETVEAQPPVEVPRLAAAPGG